MWLYREIELSVFVEYKHNDKTRKSPRQGIVYLALSLKITVKLGLCTSSYPSFPFISSLFYMYVAFVQVYLVHLPVPVHKQLVSHCVHLFIHDLTQEPSIGFICLVLCNVLMQEGCGYRSYGYLVRKRRSMTTPPKNPFVSLDHPAHL